jgi:ATP-binding cassette, subfamily B, bacterial MsbA
MSSIEHADSRAVYRRLFGYVKPYKLMFIISLIAAGCFAAIDVTLVSSFKPLISDVLQDKDPRAIFWAPIILVILVVARGVFNYISSYGMAWVGSKVVMDIRQQLFTHVLRLPMSFFDLNSSSDVIAKLTYHTEKLMAATTNASLTMAREGIMVVGSIGMMFFINMKLAAIFLATAPVIAIAVSITTKRFKQVSKRIQSAIGDVANVAEESIEGISVVKTFNGYEYESNRFYEAANKNRANNVKLVATRALSVGFVQVVASIGLGFVLWLSIEEVTSGRTGIEDLLVLLMLMLSLLKPVKQLTNINSIVQQAIEASRSIFTILDAEKELDEGVKQFNTQASQDCGLSVNQLSFQYPGSERPILDSITFDLQPGKTIALVGRSGSGKTTLTQIILRFYQLFDGDIKMNGESILDYELSSYRDQIALVGQHVALFNDTIANNIAYANPKSTREQIIQAAKNAYAWDFIQEQEHGLDTIIGENGLMLSGGQRQRLAIARALLKPSALLILDEATSALDSESEQYIQKALDKLLVDRTAIIIAHRLSTVEKADNILVLDQGKVIESGSHQNLISQQGEYSRLYNMQFSEAE